MWGRALKPQCTPHCSHLYLPLSHTITLNLSNVTWLSYEAKPGCRKTFLFYLSVQEITQMQSLQSRASTQCGHSGFAWDKSGLFFFWPPTLQTLVFCLPLPNVSYLDYLNTGGRQQWQPGLYEHILLSAYFFIGTWMLWDTACSILGFLLGKSQEKVLNFLEANYSKVGKICMLFPL